MSAAGAAGAAAARAALDGARGARQAKAEGNGAYAAGKYERAAELYTEGLHRDREGGVFERVLRANRAQVNAL